MDKNKFSWPFAKHRQSWIATADRLISEAADDLEDSGGGLPLTPKHFRQHRRAARNYERSANYYRKAGLGAMAAASWQDAAECWATIGDAKEFEKCQQEELAIDVYWEDVYDAD
jgi:hypothetical protein